MNKNFKVGLKVGLILAAVYFCLFAFLWVFVQITDSSPVSVIPGIIAIILNAPGILALGAGAVAYNNALFIAAIGFNLLFYFLVGVLFGILLSKIKK